MDFVWIFTCFLVIFSFFFNFACKEKSSWSRMYTCMLLHQLMYTCETTRKMCKCPCLKMHHNVDVYESRFSRELLVEFWVIIVVILGWRTFLTKTTFNHIYINHIFKGLAPGWSWEYPNILGPNLLTFELHKIKSYRYTWPKIVDKWLNI